MIGIMRISDAARWAVIMLFWDLIIELLEVTDDMNAPWAEEDSIHDWSRDFRKWWEI